MMSAGTFCRLLLAAGLGQGCVSLVRPKDNGISVSKQGPSVSSQSLAVKNRRGAGALNATSGPHTIKTSSDYFLYVGQGRTNKGALFRYVKKFQHRLKESWEPTPGKDDDCLWTIQGPDADGDVTIANVRWPEHYLVLWSSGAGTCTNTGAAVPPEALIQSRTPNETETPDSRPEEFPQYEKGPVCPNNWLLYKPVADAVHEAPAEGTVFMYHESKAFLSSLLRRSPRPYQTAFFVITPPVPDSMIHGDLEISTAGYGGIVR